MATSSQRYSPESTSLRKRCILCRVISTGSRIVEVPLVDTYRCCVALITTIDAHPVARLVASVVNLSRRCRVLSRHFALRLCIFCRLAPTSVLENPKHAGEVQMPGNKKRGRINPPEKNQKTPERLNSPSETQMHLERRSSTSSVMLEMASDNTSTAAVGTNSPKSFLAQKSQCSLRDRRVLRAMFIRKK